MFITELEKKLANLINTERNKKGLKSLQIDPKLSQWAKIKSRDMVKNNYFAHESPAYGKVEDMLRNNGIVFCQIGENLGKSSNVTKAHQGFMSSSVHKATILYNGYTHLGIGIAYKGSTMYVTEIFATK
ncbi:MAG: hypothetical protein PWQ67_848 [Clostridia bacterium]|nr:hypothetical protein [Clostridia bacterium]MDN5322394.1 hypothetical protein [Clostridia bacterium]